MSLVNRVSTFFLRALLVILVSYSLILYFLVSWQLHRQFDQQLHAALHQLAAAVEVENDDVKFEQSDHVIRLGTEDGLEDVRWAVYDEAGKIVARSQNLQPGTSDNDFLLSFGEKYRRGDHESLDVGDWRLLQQRLAAPQPKPVAERSPLEHEALVITVGRSTADLNTNLRLLELLVIVLPAIGLVIARVAGNWYCATALQPVLSMAADARAMSLQATRGKLDGEQRLPVADTNDELTELGVAFNALLDALFKTLAQRRRFTGDAAHQLRTPLAALRGQIEVALRRPRTADEHAATLGILLEQTTELQQMIEGLLFLARADGEAAAPSAETIQLDKWLPGFLCRWHDHPRRDDLHFHCLQPAAVTASPALLSQLLENLISNALKYSDAGTDVDIELRRTNDSTIIAVRDHGLGISPAERAAIFDPFYRSPGARKSGIAGTGLGLAIASRIATALGGELTCEAVDGPGSCFVYATQSRSNSTT